MNLPELLLGAHVALRLIQARLLTLVALLLTFALFAWAMWSQTVLGAIIAGVWGLSIFLPVLLTGRGGYDGSTTQRSQRATQDPDVGAAEAGT